VRDPAEAQGGEHVQPRHGGAEHSRGGDLRRRRPPGEADPAGAPPADEDVGGGDRQRPEEAVGVVPAHRRGRREAGAGEVGRAHGEILRGIGVGDRQVKGSIFGAGLNSLKFS